MKRFTDTALWDKEWFMNFSPIEKVAWYYIKDKCDNVGVWSPNFGLANFVIGKPVDWDKLLIHSNGNITAMDNGKWFIVDFVDFQYGELKETCPPHKSYIKLLSKHGLLKGYSKGISTLQDKDKEKDKDKDKEKEEEKKHGDKVKLADSKYEMLCYQYGSVAVNSKIDDINNYCLSKGKKYSDYAATIRAWFKKDGVVPKMKPKVCKNGHFYTGRVCEECI